jgi:hypothetical protein
MAGNTKRTVSIVDAHRAKQSSAKLRVIFYSKIGSTGDSYSSVGDFQLLAPVPSPQLWVWLVSPQTSSIRAGKNNKKFWEELLRILSLHKAFI